MDYGVILGLEHDFDNLTSLRVIFSVFLRVKLLMLSIADSSLELDGCNSHTG